MKVSGIDGVKGEASSNDLTPLDCCHLKNKVYATQPNPLQDLIQRITSNYARYVSTAGNVIEKHYITIYPVIKCILNR